MVNGYYLDESSINTGLIILYMIFSINPFIYIFFLNQMFHELYLHQRLMFEMLLFVETIFSLYYHIFSTDISEILLFVNLNNSD